MSDNACMTMKTQTAMIGELRKVLKRLHYPLEVMLALNPWYAVRVFADNGSTGSLVLYAVFLATTGGEALYAKLGHFGRQPIRRV